MICDNACFRASTLLIVYISLSTVYSKNAETLFLNNTYNVLNVHKGARHKLHCDDVWVDLKQPYGTYNDL